jgi:hypothetical protein
MRLAKMLRHFCFVGLRRLFVKWLHKNRFGIADQ